MQILSRYDGKEHKGSSFFEPNGPPKARPLSEYFHFFLSLFYCEPRGYREETLMAAQGVN